MSRDRVNSFAELEYFDPSKVLLEAQRQGFSHRPGAREAVLRRGHEHNGVIEHLDATVFAHGLAMLMPHLTVHIARLERQDHDFVLRFVHEGEPYYCPLQLKELVPAEVNPHQEPERLIASLAKYGDAEDLEVAIKVSREAIDPRALPSPQLRLGGLWFFGGLGADPRRWYVYGNCLDSPSWFEFPLP